MPTLVHERVEAARAGTNPTVIYRMPSGWAVLCDVQYLRGYSLLLPDPVVPDLNALDKQKRAEYLSVKVDYERDKELIQQIAAAVRRQL